MPVLNSPKPPTGSIVYVSVWTSTSAHPVAHVPSLLFWLSMKSARRCS